jgi:DNA-binding GntR family transcriptional regulator
VSSLTEYANYCMLSHTMPKRRTAASKPKRQRSGSREGMHGELRSSERVYRQIREAILSGELRSHSRLVELTLAEQFGVSRTPVREALKRLSAEGLVIIDPPNGTVVRGIDEREVEEIYTIREVLDGLAARLAAHRILPEDLTRLKSLMEIMTTALEERREEALVQANIRFHDIIYGAAESTRLTELGRSLNDFIRRFSREAFQSFERDREVLGEHQAIIEALDRRDPEAAERLAREHMRNARAFLARWNLMADFVSNEDQLATD